VMRSRDEDKKYYIYASLKSRGTDSYVNNLQSRQRSMQCNMHTNNSSDNDPTSIDLQQLSKTGSTRISNAQSTATKPFDP
jgi:hypothetical protein